MSKNKLKTKNEIRSWLLTEVAKIIKSHPNEVDTNTPFSILGLTSLDAIQLMADFNKSFDKKYSPALLFDYPDINSLISFLINEKEKVEIVDRTFSIEPIAIIGMAGKFPEAENLNEYWDLLENNKDAIKPLPENRWASKPEFPVWGGFIENPDKFDNEVFQVLKKEAKHLDPQQRLIMEVSWHALEDAGYNPASLKGSQTGVFIGISTNDYALEKVSSKQVVDVFDGIGGAHSITANRLSYFYDFHGPSWAIDTACSSSLVAIIQACNELQNGQSEMALAGGVNILYSPYLTIAFKKAGMLSPEGRCKTFSSDANGYVRGEGAGVVILKRLSDAIRDKNKIYGVVKGSAINQDGRSNGITAPNGQSQRSVVKSALRSAGLDINDIGYLEAHGTGTPLGDPIEYHALKDVFKERVADLNIGSVKTNIGHLEAAAGVAGVIKVLLSMKNKLIPGSLNFKEINPKINIKESPLKITTQNIPWAKNLNAGVSSFGFGGTNAHIILQAYEESQSTPLEVENLHEDFIINISSSSLEGLKKQAEKILDASKLTPLEFSNFIYRLNQKDSGLIHRLSISTTQKDLNLKLRSFLDDKFHKNVLYKNKKSKNNSGIAFVFTGQGAQYPGMGRELYENFKVYRDTFNEVSDYLQEYLGESLADIIFRNDDRKIYETIYGQATLFVLEYSLFKLYLSFGLTPDCFIGHSLGEVVALVCSNTMSLKDGCKLIANRAMAMQKSPIGAMISINTNKQSIESELSGKGLSYSFAAYNAPELTVLSGQIEDLDKIEIILSGKYKVKKLPIKHAFHSPLMNDILPSFKAGIEGIEFLPPEYPVYSCFLGKYLDKDDLNADFFANHIIDPTDFLGAVQKIEADSIASYIEVGPHPTLVHLINSSLKSGALLYTPLNRKRKSLASFLEMLGKLYIEGVELNYKPFYRKDFTYIDVPHTEFQNTTFTFRNSQEVIMTKKSKIPLSQLLVEVQQLVADELEFDINELDINGQIMDFGADSLVLLNTLETIKDRYGVAISVTDVFQDLGTIKEIVDYVYTNLPEEEIEQTNTQPIDRVSMDSSLTISSDGSVQELINRQLDIMQLQLQALGQGTITQKLVSKPQSKSSTPTNKQSDELKGKGVLGRFNSNINNDISLEGQEKSKFIKDLVRKFTAKTQKSKKHNEKYRIPLSDNRVSAGFRPQLKEMVYPIIFEKAKGASFTDIDGNKYIDFTMGFGVNLFGHSPDFIDDAVKKQLESGMAVGPQSDMAGPVAKIFCELTCNERVAFVNSGTEAVMTAIRLARAQTKREKIVIFEGSYHGHFDGVLGRSNSKGETLPVAPGVPNGLVEEVIVLEYNDAESLNRIRELGDELAAVIVEPVQSRYPEVRPGEFLKELRKITKNNGTAFIFDEVITGFRIRVGGAQEHFGVKADLAAYGKVLGGGLPIGAIGGSHKYLDAIDGGEWHFGDNSMPTHEMTFFAGTFCKHPLAMAASYQVLEKISAEGDKIFSDLNTRTEKLANELNIYFSELGLDLHIVNFGSLFRFKYTGNMDLLFYLLNNKGIYIWEGRNMFISTAHTEEDIKTFIDKTKESVEELIKSGFITSTKKKSIDRLVEYKSFEMTDSHKRFIPLCTIDKELRSCAHISVALRLVGEIDKKVLEKSVNDVLYSHDFLNTSYDIKNEKILFAEKKEISLDNLDFSTLENPEQELKNWMMLNGSKPFDLKNELVRMHLVKINKSEHILSLVGHHMAMDGLSVAMISFDIAQRYSDLVKKLKPKSLKIYSFENFLQENKKSSKLIQEQKDYWMNELENLPVALFPNKKPLAFKGGRVQMNLGEEQSKKIRLFGYKNKSSLMVTFLTNFLEHLAINFSRNDLIIGVPVAGHTSIKESMVGNCVNLIPLRLKSNDKEIAERIKEVKKYQLTSFKYNEYSYEQLKKDLGLSPIEIILNVEPLTELPKFEGLKSSLINYPQSASEFPVYLNVMKVDNEIELVMDYQNQVFDQDKAEKFLNDFVNLLGKNIGC